MKIKLKFLLIIIFFQYISISGNDRVEIILKDKVVVFGPVVTLGELADIICNDEELKKSLSEAEILVSPPPLKVRIINYLYIINRLKQNHLNADKIKISGNNEIIISTDVKEIPENEIVRFVENYLNEKLSYKPENREIKIDMKIGNIIAPSKELRLKVIEKKIGMTKGSFRIGVGIYNGEKLYRSIVVPVEVRTFEDVVVAKENIKAGSVIKRDDLIFKREETTTFGNDIIYNLDDAVGKKTKTSIGKEGILKGNLLENPPVIEKGKFISITVFKGNVVVTAPGKALEDGHINEFIKVFNLSSKENLMAQVNGNNSVVVK